MALGPIARIFWGLTIPDFRIPELRTLPPHRLPPLDAAPVPRAPRAPHTWPSQDLPLPSVSGGRQSIAQLHAAFLSGSVTPRQVLDELLARHEALGPASPFIVVDPERARSAADASTARYASGEPLGPLDGVPVPVKDEFHMRGLPTRGGATYLEDEHHTDAWLIRSLQAAGAVIPGKTHATEWGLDPCGYIEHFAHPANPYRSDAAAGGSSTGSGVAVSLGLCSAAIGTDGGGSVRIPAALNGVFGIKPTYIRIGRTGDQWGNNTVSHIGVLAQTTQDLVSVLEATAGVDPDDPLTTWAPDEHSAAPWHAALSRGVEGCRIGVIRGEFEDASPDVAAACRAALERLRAEGAEIIEIDVPLARLAGGIGALTIGTETAANLADDLRTHDANFGASLRAALHLMKQVTQADLGIVARARAGLRNEVAEALGMVDVLALPTTATVAPTYHEKEHQQAIIDASATQAMTRFNFLGNLTGLPAGTAPVGMVDGLPVGLQIVGDAWDEASVFAVLAQLERAGVCDAVPRPPSFKVASL